MTSIRRTLTVRLLLGSFALLVVVDAAMAWLITSRLEDEFDHALAAKTRTIATLVEQKGDEIEFDFPDEAMPEFGDDEDGPEYFELSRAAGDRVGASVSLGDDETLAAPPRGDTDELAFADVDLPDGRAGRAARYDFDPRVDLEEEDAEVALTASGETIGVTLVVARSSEELDAMLRSIYLVLAALSLFYVGGAALVIRYAVRAGLRPLGAINRQIELVDGGSLSARVGVDPAVVELDPVVGALNRMLDRVESAWRRERTFSSDVAHELRTPLAELRNLAEVGGKWPGDEAAARRFFDDVRDIAAQMEKLTSALMTIARSENGAEQVEREDVSLHGLVDACWGGVSAAASSRRVTIRNDVPDEAVVHTDAALMRTVVSNLLDNAAAYASEGSTVSCTARRSGDVFELTVDNDTTGLEPGDESSLFERFWRKDPSRTDGLRSGLGLSVVRAICDLLGYRVAARLDGRRLSLVISSLPPART